MEDGESEPGLMFPVGLGVTTEDKATWYPSSAPRKVQWLRCVVGDPSLLPEAAGFKRALLIALIS